MHVKIRDVVTRWKPTGGVVRFYRKMVNTGIDIRITTLEYVVYTASLSGDVARNDYTLFVNAKDTKRQAHCYLWHGERWLLRGRKM